MSLKSLIKKASKLAFTSVGDIASSGALKVRGRFEINAFSETFEVKAENIFSVEAILYSFQEAEIDGNVIRREDLKAISHIDFFPKNILPTSKDLFVANGKNYSIISSKVDPTGSVVILHLRLS